MAVIKYGTIFYDYMIKGNSNTVIESLKNEVSLLYLNGTVAYYFKRRGIYGLILGNNKGELHIFGDNHLQQLIPNAHWYYLVTLVDMIVNVEIY